MLKKLEVSINLIRWATRPEHTLYLLYCFVGKKMIITCSLMIGHLLNAIVLVLTENMVVWIH